MVRTEEIMKVVPEEGTATFRLAFKDEMGIAVAPTSIVWDLTALDGTVIAYNQVVAVPAALTYVTISGAYFRILAGEESYGERLITFRWRYNSTNGNDLVHNKQIKFRVQNLKLIGYPIAVSVVDLAFTDDYIQNLGVA